MKWLTDTSGPRSAGDKIVGRAFSPIRLYGLLEGTGNFRIRTAPRYIENAKHSWRDEYG